jgi:hypothetical protein
MRYELGAIKKNAKQKKIYATRLANRDMQLPYAYLML